MENTIYEWLMDKRNTEKGWTEARLFALMLSFRSTSCYWSIEDMLGLTKWELKTLVSSYFPFTIDAFPFIKSDDLQPTCYKIHFHSAVDKPFICHCCGQAVAPGGKTRKIDIPIFPGYPTAVNRQMEVDDLKGLLLSHRSSNSVETFWLASMIAVGALGENHLWQDLGLSGREDVSFILKNYFTDLFNKNTGDMKWKKFFYKQLCDLDDINVCKAPSCSVCSHFFDCFGPEEAQQNAA